MRKRDRLLLIILSAMAIVICAVLLIVSLNHGDAGKAVVYYKNEVIASFDLDKDTEYLIETELGTNLLVIRDGRVFIKEADCRDKICVNTGSLGSDDDIRSIICLPHKLTVRVEHEK